MYNRATSVYQVETAGDETVLDEMIRRCPLELVGSGVNRGGTVFIRLRVASDLEALDAALTACEGREFTLATGYGVNRREVLGRPYEGECWNCFGTNLVIRPDAGMQDVTDEVVCLDCSETQPTD